MGGREASSTYYKLGGEGHVYGDEYKSAIHGFDNVKIVAMTKNTSLKAPQESKTPGRIYATINKETGKLHSLSYMGSDGKRYKQVDASNHKSLKSHAHDGLNHNSPARKLSRKERRQLAMVRRYIRRFGGRG